MITIPHFDAYELTRDIPGLPRGVVFIHDPMNLTGQGSPFGGCMVLAWDNGGCQGNWCGATYILPGQVHRDESWFVKVDNPMVSSGNGTERPRFYIRIEQETYCTIN